MRKFRGTFIALAIMLVLAAYIVFTTGRDKPETDMDERMIFGMAPDAMQEICIAHGDDEVIVKKDSDRTWAVKAPGTYEISQEAVNDLVKAVAHAEFDKEIESDPSDLEEFGLSAPDTRIEVKGHRGRKKTLLIGSATPVGSGYYGKSVDDPKVYFIPMTVADALIKTTDDLREKRVVKASGESIDGIRLVRRIDGDITDVICEKRGETWYLARPIVDKADKEKIDELILDTTGLTVEEFVDDEGSDLECWGLDQPRLRIDLTVAGEGLRVFIGDPGPNEEGFYFKTGDAPNVYFVKPRVFSPLEFTPPDLVDSQLVQLDRDEVIGVTWTVDEDGGSRIAGDGKSFGSSKLDRLVTALQDIRITGVGEMLGYDIDYASYGLDNPVICVQLDLENGSIFEVKIGKELEKGFYAIATGRDFVYLVAKDGIEALDEVLRELSP